MLTVEKPAPSIYLSFLKPWNWSSPGIRSHRYQQIIGSHPGVLIAGSLPDTSQILESTSMITGRSPGLKHFWDHNIRFNIMPRALFKAHLAPRERPKKRPKVEGAITRNGNTFWVEPTRPPDHIVQQLFHTQTSHQGDSHQQPGIRNQDQSSNTRVNRSTPHRSPPTTSAS